jgi:hypothetical protein
MWEETMETTLFSERTAAVGFVLGAALGALGAFAGAGAMLMVAGMGALGATLAIAVRWVSRVDVRRLLAAYLDDDGRAR